MKKIIILLVLITSLILGGCSHMFQTSEKNKVPYTMPIQKYTGQGFQPKAEKDSIEFAKKHQKEFAELGERFFKDNFGLKVKATNVVGSGYGVQVFVHCDDHDIVFNSSINLDKDSLGYKGSARATEESDDLSFALAKVMSGFDYKANKEEYDKLYQYLEKNSNKYEYTGYTEEALMKTQDIGYKNKYFWISGTPTTLEKYERYYKPLIQQSNPDFKKNYFANRKIADNVDRSALIVTLFDKRKKFNKVKELDKLMNIAKDIKAAHVNPEVKDVEISLTYTSNIIFTEDAMYSTDSYMDIGGLGIEYDD